MDAGRLIRMFALMTLGLLCSSVAQAEEACEPADRPNTYVPVCPSELAAYKRATEDAQRYFAANPRNAYGDRNKLCPTRKTRNNGPYVWVASVPTVAFACTEQGSGYVNPIFRAQFKPDATTPPDAGSQPFDPGKNNQCNITTGPNMQGNPINLVTGHKVQSATDFSDPAGHLDFSRFYTSAQTVYNPWGALGFGWRHGFQSAVVFYPSRDPRLIRPSGNSYPFQQQGDQGVFASDVAEQITVLTENGQRTGWRVLSTDDTVEYFNAQGLLTRMEFNDGDVLTLSYNTDQQLVQVTDRRSRVLAFSYVGGKMESVMLPDGASIRFVHEDELLTAVQHWSSQQLIAGSISYLYEDPIRPELLTGIVDESGDLYASWTYDAYGRALTSRHGGVDSPIDLVTLSYQPGKTLVTSALGDTVSYGHVFQQLRGKVTSTDKACSTCRGRSAQSITYDANGYPSQRADFRGTTTSVQYDTRGLPVREVAAANDAGGNRRTVETDWHPVFRVPVERRVIDAGDVLINATAHSYNTRGQALSATETDPVTGQSRTATTSYCEQADVAAGTCPWVGLVKTEVAPGGTLPTTYRYYPSDDSACATPGAACSHRKGDLWKVTNALGHTAEYLAYDNAGRVTQQKDANGVLTSFTYHPRGWLASRRVHGASAADDRLTEIEYWPTGLTKRVVEPDGSFISHRYDSAHRLVEVSDNTGNHIQYVLDNAGNRVAENTRDPAGALKRTLSRLYNTLGELVTQADASANPTDYTYDSNGNPTTATDALGRVSRSDYDSLNRLKRSLQDVGGIEAEVQYRYDALDNLVEVTDPKGLKTHYARNAFGEVVTQTSPDTGVTTMTYDSAGNMATRTDARGVTATYQYDALNRLTHISYPDPTLDVAYTYDIAPAVCAASEQFSRGRVGTVIHAGGSTQYCHDRFGQLTRKVQTVNGVATTVRYGYTAGGRLAALTYPDGTVADYLRDNLGRINEVGVTRPGQARQVVVTNVTYAPFGPATGWTYGNGRTLQRPVDQDYRTIAVHDPAPGGLSVGYGYDAVGGIAELTNGDGTEVLAQYSYDALGRLTQTKDGATGTPIETYEYDATGNRTSLTTSAGMKAYTYAASSHRLAAVDTSTRDYDAAGNTLTIEGQEFVYSDSNRMRQVKQGGAVAEEYVYNHRGERVEREAIAADAEYSIYDEAGQWLANFNSFGQVEQQAIWLDSFPVALVTAASSEGHVLAYVQPDHLGTPRTVIDEARNVAVWEWNSRIEAFGNQSPNFDPDSDGVQFALAMRFPGQRYDASSGLHYNYFRNYDASTGRYIESDPIGLQGSMSTYGYVDGNPLRWSDPLGLVRWDGTVLAASAARYGAVGAYVFNLTSQCVKGRKAKVLYRAAAGGFGFGVKGMPWINGTASKVSLEDYLPDIHPSNMNGMFFQMGFGVSVLGTGAGCYGYQLGSGFTPAMTKWSNMCGFGGAGLDASASMMWGSGEVVSVKWEKCDECEPVDSRF